MSNTMKIELSMYGIAEVLHWCHDRNKGRVPGVDTAGFDTMKAFLAEKPQEIILSSISFGRSGSPWI